MNTRHLKREKHTSKTTKTATKKYSFWTSMKAYLFFTAVVQIGKLLVGIDKIPVFFHSLNFSPKIIVLMTNDK